MAGRGNLLEDAGLVGGMKPDREEDRLGAVGGEGGENCGRVLRPGAVVEGQHDLAFAQEIMALEVLEAEAGAAGGVDLDGAGDPEGIGVAAGGCGRRRRRLRHHRRRFGLLDDGSLHGVGAGARPDRRSLSFPGCCQRGRRRAGHRGPLQENRAKHSRAQDDRERGRYCCQTHVRPPSLGFCKRLGRREPEFPPISLIPP